MSDTTDRPKLSPTSAGQSAKPSCATADCIWCTAHLAGYHPRHGPWASIAGSVLRYAAENIVKDGIALVEDEVPGLTVKTSPLYGWPAEHLGTLSAGAGLLVVGSRGIGGFMGLLVGSVSLELAATADCPVAVVRTGEHQGGPVVVGVDIDDGERALRQACTLAALTGARLRVVHVQRKQRGLHPGTADNRQARELLDWAAGSALAMAPGLEVEERLLTGAHRRFPADGGTGLFAGRALRTAPPYQLTSEHGVSQPGAAGNSMIGRVYPES